jgi:hypothetical protein
MKSTRKFTRLILLLSVLLLLTKLTGCKNDHSDNPQQPYVNITLDPNSTIYQGLNIVSGWMYLGESDGVYPPSRGIIVYRMTEDQFTALERTPVYKPDSCCGPNNTDCTKLVVDGYYPFVMDTCTNSKYLIIDGSPVSGPSSTPLVSYVAEYDGYLLHIHN